MRFQCIEQPVGAASSQVSAIFKSEPARPAISDQADGFEVETRPLALDPFAFGVCAADVLARWAAHDDVGKDAKVGNKSSCREVADVVVEPDMRKILRIEDAAPFHDLAGGDGDETGAVQTEGPATRGTAEEIERAHHGRRSRRLSQVACCAFV
ncbi:hypothetical protein GCM10017635_12260 [Paracoccus kondratievae]|uniref:Uncharacterized protein n=1 Tax=Paracoccus kondratievae TaxID=135740 RepID=A0AAD3NYM4_9RHOB|nr:hypothetical protein GCM10017635_12260 [Paracoccus kondratievae]